MINVQLEIIIIFICASCFLNTEANYLIEELSIHHPPHHHYGKENAVYFSNKWAVKISVGENADKIAEMKNFRYHGCIDGFQDYHIFEKTDHPEEHNEESFHHTYNLTDHDNVIWAQQIFGRQLYKRDFLYEQNFFNFGPKFNFEISAGDDVRRMFERNLYSVQKNLAEKHLVSSEMKENTIGTLYEGEFNDELWTLQWYELGYKINAQIPVLDMNLVPVYKVYNITGDGVNILIIDDGIEYTHEDLKDNFNKEISFNLNKNETDIMPRYEDPRNRHGTRCAGVAAMGANNTKCGVGIAYNAKVGGITLLDGVTDDVLESQAIKYANDQVDIYNGSWGPQDNGQALEGPGHLSSLALHYGATNGRNGLGSLYVFAAGNGGVFGDHCGADGYVNSIYSITIASATQNGDAPFYSERCPAIIATAYSGSRHAEIKVITTDIHNSCTLEHSGTSASAPLAAGVLALVLEANPRVTWRDVQHMIVWTSEIAPLKRDVDWYQNAFGLWFTPQFGFGLLNAFKLVTNALKWKNVPEKFLCSVPFNLDDSKRTFTSDSDFTASVFTDACGNAIRYLEHVQLNVTAEYTVRGYMEIELISPSGTKSKLMEVRKHDFSSTGFKAWPFLSLQFWGENPLGVWTVSVADKVRRPQHRGRVEHLQLILHGTKEIPPHYVETKREYEPFLV